MRPEPLPGWTFGRATRADDGAWVVPATHDDDRIETCRHCGGMLWSFGALAREVRDVPYLGVPVRLAVTRRRYRCSVCLGTTLATVPGLIAQASMTQRLAEYVASHAGGRHGDRLAAETGLSPRTVRRIMAGA